jgi:hypothetical protein
VESFGWGCWGVGNDCGVRELFLQRTCSDRLNGQGKLMLVILVAFRRDDLHIPLSPLEQNHLYLQISYCSCPKMRSTT